MSAETNELRLPDEFSYKMPTGDEVIVAAALSRYLKKLNRSTVKQLLGSALKDDPAYPQGYLSDLIDGAISDALEMLEEEQMACQSAEAKDLREKCITRLEVVYGQDVVENMSAEFLKYIVDCYETLTGSLI